MMNSFDGRTDRVHYAPCVQIGGELELVDISSISDTLILVLWILSNASSDVLTLQVSWVGLLDR